MTRPTPLHPKPLAQLIRVICANWAYYSRTLPADPTPAALTTLRDKQTYLQSLDKA